MDIPRNLLVVGARPNSLGEHVYKAAVKAGWSVSVVGQSEGVEPLDITYADVVAKFLDREDPFRAVVCTAGINSGPYSITTPSQFNLIGNTVAHVLTEHLRVNVVGPMILLNEWVNTLPLIGRGGLEGCHYVAISSNSARLARSKSLPYCASKAALSMALRCAARELAYSGVNIYGYEPGWLEGTPMSEDILEALAKHGNIVPHRIPSGKPIDTEWLADTIVRNLDHHGDLNGCLIRIDGGEQ